MRGPTGQNASRRQDISDRTLCLSGSIFQLDSSQVFPLCLPSRIHPRGHRTQSFELSDRDRISRADRPTDISCSPGPTTLKEGQGKSTENDADELRVKETGSPPDDDPEAS